MNGFSSLPNDPFVLFSYLNTQLRDRYSSLSDLCEDLEVDETALAEKLHAAGFDYDPAQNRFR